MRPVGQAVKTPPFHGGNRGSIPLRVTKENHFRKEVVFVLYGIFDETAAFVAVVFCYGVAAEDLLHGVFRYVMMNKKSVGGMNMRTIALTPYEGEQPYIFISYAHKDSEQVYPILEELNRLGYRVCGIEQGAFQNNSMLKKVTLPVHVADIGLGAFNSCSALEEVEILGDQGENLVIDAPAFAGCSNLRKVILPGRVTEISSNAFNGCSGLKELVLSDQLKSIGVGAFKQTGLEELALPDSVKSIEDSAFENCSQLRSVVLPNALKTIFYRTFYDCTALESVWIPASVTAIEEDAFFNCGALRNVYYGGTEQQWKKLMSDIDFNYPTGTVLRNNMALQEADIHFNAY